MKKFYFLFFLVLLIGNTAVSQDAKNNRVIAFTATKMRVVYAALENPLCIAASGIAADKIKVSSDKGILKPDKGSGKYLLAVPDIRTENIKEITITVSDGTRELYKEVLRVKQVASPLAYFGDKDGGEITQEEIKAANAIQIYIKDFVFDGLEYTVKKYKFVLAHKKSTTVVDVTGSKFPEAMKTALASAVKGDMIIITDIYASFPGSSDKRIPGAITLTVSN